MVARTALLCCRCGGITGNAVDALRHAVHAPRHYDVGAQAQIDEKKDDGDDAEDD
jgi:hypothetical protein